MSEIPGEEDLLASLSFRPRHLLRGMITINNPVKPLSLEYRSDQSSAGLLDRLPLEILHLTLNILDFQSLSCLSGVSQRGRDIVESLPAYSELMEYAPDMIKALIETSLDGLHPVGKLHAILRSGNCVSCREFGPYLFLPTSERCCYECLRHNQSLWVIPLPLAKQCFKLTQHDLKNIPLMRSIPGVYTMAHRDSRQGRQTLVSVKVAKELAIRINGSVPVTDTTILPDMSNRVIREMHTLKWLREAPLEPLPDNPSRLPSMGNIPNDNCGGMASIKFPLLENNKTLEHGHWCLGCNWTFEQYRLGRLPKRVMDELVPGKLHPVGVFNGMHRRARSKSEFIAHIPQCYGANNMPPSAKYGWD